DVGSVPAVTLGDGDSPCLRTGPPSPERLTPTKPAITRTATPSTATSTGVRRRRRPGLVARYRCTLMSPLRPPTARVARMLPELADNHSTGGAGPEHGHQALQHRVGVGLPPRGPELDLLPVGGGKFTEPHALHLHGGTGPRHERAGMTATHQGQHRRDLGGD